MFTAVPEFEWSVCRQKYQFTADRGSKRRLEAAGPDFDRKQPFAINALFARFADASTERKMLEFCNQWGLPIGLGAQSLVAKNRFLGRMYSAGVRDLMKHQASMRRAVAAFERGDLSEIMNICNVTESVVSTRLQLRRDAGGKLKLHYEPPNLLGAMWLQFAQLVCDGGRLHRCERCAAPIAVGPGTGRRNTSQWCGNACKVAVYKTTKKGRLAHNNLTRSVKG